MIDSVSIGLRIADARRDCGITSQEALATLLGKKRQTVSNWERGGIVPHLREFAALAKVFAKHGKPEYDEECLLFGSRREQQLREQRPVLAWVTPAEEKLLTIFRQADESGQRDILAQANVSATNHPAPTAEIKLLRRKDDIRP